MTEFAHCTFNTCSITRTYASGRIPTPGEQVVHRSIMTHGLWRRTPRMGGWPRQPMPWRRVVAWVGVATNQHWHPIRNTSGRRTEQHTQPGGPSTMGPSPTGRGSREGATRFRPPVFHCRHIWLGGCPPMVGCATTKSGCVVPCVYSFWIVNTSGAPRVP